MAAVRAVVNKAACMTSVYCSLSGLGINPTSIGCEFLTVKTIGGIVFIHCNLFGLSTTDLQWITIGENIMLVQ